MASTTASKTHVAQVRAITPDTAKGAGSPAQTAAPGSGWRIDQLGTVSHGGGVIPSKGANPLPTSGQVGPAASSTGTSGSGAVYQPVASTPSNPVSNVIGMTQVNSAPGDQGGTVGGLNNALSGDVLGKLGLTVPKLLEYLAIAIAAWLAWRWMVANGNGKRR
jgi:hypothetical protein